MRKHERRGRVAGNHDRIRREEMNEPGHDFADARHQRRLAQSSIRKARVIGDIDALRVGAQPHHFGEHGQAAEAGIEDKDLGRMLHADQAIAVGPDEALARSAAKIDPARVCGQPGLRVGHLGTQAIKLKFQLRLYAAWAYVVDRSRNKDQRDGDGLLLPLAIPGGERMPIWLQQSLALAALIVGLVLAFVLFSVVLGVLGWILKKLGLPNPIDLGWLDRLPKWLVYAAFIAILLGASWLYHPWNWADFGTGAFAVVILGTVFGLMYLLAKLLKVDPAGCCAE
jgi:hypothetical protein